MAVLKGIDVSSWQAGLNVANINADFVIAKATEGIGYVDKNCDVFIQQAKQKNKLRGVYHFARNSYNSAKSEADFFLNNTKGYIGECLLVLDWEDAAYDVAWAKSWLDIVYKSTGIKPLIYMNESTVNSHDWSSVAKAGYGLWVAKYRDMVADFNHNMNLAGEAPRVNHWNGYVMWQWTSSGRLDGYGGDLDCNVFYGDRQMWNKYVGVSSNESTPAPAVQNPEPRKVWPVTYKIKPGDTLSGIAAMYGTNWKHLAAINGIQNPNLIYAGQVLTVSGASNMPQTVTVMRGDTLSGIASRTGTTWQELARKNGITNPHLIYPGQTLRI